MLTKKNLIIIALIALFLMAIGFGIGKLFEKPVIIKEEIDTKIYDHIVDSVMLEFKQAQFIIDEQQKHIDSLQIQLKSKNQHTRETKQIKNFTPDSRRSWRDSVRATIPR